MYDATRRPFPHPAAPARAADAACLARRMLPVRRGAPDPAPFGHDKPSNSLFLPPEYRAANCHVCSAYVEDLSVVVGSSFVDRSTKVTVLVSGRCLYPEPSPHGGPGANIPYDVPFTFVVLFGDGAAKTHTPGWPTPAYSTRHVYRKEGWRTVTAAVHCVCASLFALAVESETFYVHCPTVPKTAVPSGVLGFRYDAAGKSWKAKVTRATSGYTIWWRNEVREASAALATAGNCEQMLDDLNYRRTRPKTAPFSWYLEAAVKAHEYGHLADWQTLLDAQFTGLTTAVEALSVPHECGKTPQQAKAELVALKAYGDAVKAALRKAAEEFRDFEEETAESRELPVVDPVIAAIRAKAGRNPSWPAACRP